MKELKAGLIILGFFIVFCATGTSDFQDFQMMSGIAIKATSIWKIFTVAFSGIILILLGLFLPENSRKGGGYGIN